jgi:hypothetical protein
VRKQPGCAPGCAFSIRNRQFAIRNFRGELRLAANDDLGMLGQNVQS